MSNAWNLSPAKGYPDAEADLDLVWDNAEAFPSKPAIVCGEPLSGEPPRFTADARRLQDTDYPVTTGLLPVFSQRMLEALLSAGACHHRATPVAIRDTAGRPVTDHDYVLVQLLEDTDAFDRERSDFRESRRVAGFVRIRHLVLREPPGGFPPLFRIAERRSKLFVSDAARRALEAAGIVGLQFRPPEEG